MKTILIASACGLVLPLFASASTYSYTAASADSGGNVAEGGEVITGASSASVSVHTSVSSDTNGGHTDISIVTSKDGVVQREERHTDIPQGGSVTVSVATSTGTASSVSVSSIIAPALNTAKKAASGAAAAESVSVAAKTVTSVESDAEATTTGRLLAVDRIDSTWLGNWYQHVHSFIANIFSALPFF